MPQGQPLKDKKKKRKKERKKEKRRKKKVNPWTEIESSLVSLLVT